MVFTEIRNPPAVVLYAGAPPTPAARHVVRVQSRPDKGGAGVLVPTFLSKDRAERFVRSFGGQGQGMTVFQLESLDALEALLADLIAEGVTHVQVDPDPDRPGPEPDPIDQVINGLELRT
jgi:hypothetical protein